MKSCNMSVRNNETELRRHALAIEDAISAPDPLDNQYGRRIETDRSWTVYHVFTGRPACIDDSMMTGLSRSEATDKMMSLNRCNANRRRERIGRPLRR
jgi:hypothetical protein